ncbi:hypothetical protein Ahy_A02g008518 [Arachis hypogaea]|uniref:Uncharacterized protein n=1 Tax=Arachis hypogaea TaxID=3818 RepID=A0A445EF99_ARAHY|nr:hypothetical protein Ahy_A02g008518 [Arachis hypogaea]
MKVEDNSNQTKPWIPSTSKYEKHSNHQKKFQIMVSKRDTDTEFSLSFSCLPSFNAIHKTVPLAASIAIFSGHPLDGFMSGMTGIEFVILSNLVWSLKIFQKIIERSPNSQAVEHDILKRGQLLSPRAMVVDSIQILDPINTVSSFLSTLLTLFFFYHLTMSLNLTFCFDLCILEWSEQKLNLPLPSTLSNPAKDELGTGSSDDEDDNISD